MGRTIAIDGPSGAGKSTVARMLAELMGFKYLDTGALYRAVALGLVRQGISPEDGNGRIGDALDKISMVFRSGRVFLDGEDVSDEIRTPEVGHYSSVFSARAPVREHLLPIQKDAARNDDLVAEGRDMTTVVFPDAWKKFYLDASREARAERRYLQLRQNGAQVTMDRALEDVTKRDERDSTRDISPLKRAGDAVYIDSSGLSIEEVMKAVLEAVKA
jgi:cytidylate kinase